jgi:hypothetical protein
MKDTSKFYLDLPGFQKFETLAADHVYHEVPDDWYLVISDIEGSTNAIAGGRYRDVNMLGAASVAVVQAHFAGEAFPFIFGGDGATFLIPPGKIEAVRHSLSVLKSFSHRQFGLGLRVGIMRVKQIHEAGHKVEVARFEIAHGKCTAFIRGGGVTWAESQIKNPKLSLCIEASREGALDALSGLSCRWQPLESQRGRMLAILVQPRRKGAEVNLLLDKVLKKFGQILGGTTDIASPVSQANMHYKSFWACLRAEWKMNPNKFSSAFRSRMIELFACIWSFKWGLKELFPAAAYQAEIPSHSDYRKFDDMLRLVLDCSNAQVIEIREYLEECHARGEIFYGVHESSHALMTCFVENIRPGGHIHFIDGFDGGYALAAKQLKEQVALSKQYSQSA